MRFVILAQICVLFGCATKQPASAECGDGVVQAGEDCDDGSETWECDAQCHRKTLYVACESRSDCGDEEDCVNGACTEFCEQQSDGAFHCPDDNLPKGATGVTCYLDEQPHEGWCRALCRADGDCPTGLMCSDNVCQVNR
jgi:hypothetical protein